MLKLSRTFDNYREHKYRERYRELIENLSRTFLKLSRTCDFIENLTAYREPHNYRELVKFIENLG